MNSRRYRAPASRPLGVPMACSMTIKRPGITRVSACSFANATIGCFTPAATSSRSLRNSASASGPLFPHQFGVLERAREIKIIGAGARHGDAHAVAVDVLDGLERGVLRHDVGALDHDIGRG